MSLITFDGFPQSVSLSWGFDRMATAVLFTLTSSLRASNLFGLFRFVIESREIEIAELDLIFEN